MEQNKIIILAGDGRSTKILYNYLSNQFNIQKVIIEASETKKVFLKRRIKRLGLIKVFGQIAFQLILPKCLKLGSKSRASEIMKKFKMNDSVIDENKIYRVQSINSSEVIKIINEFEPDVILVNGTRIISKKVLNSTNVKFINIHMGITPSYRGVHGGYWALVNKEPEQCGVTVHFVDAGIDTGKILKQGLIEPGKSDNFTTYPLIQLGIGLELLKETLNEFLKGEVKQKVLSNERSRLWSHPTIWGYIFNFIVHGIK